MKALILLILLTGCSTPKPEFNPTTYNTTAYIRFAIGKDTEELFGENVKAYTICYTGGYCALWVPEIKVLDALTLCLWGEELAHVVYGPFHKKGEVSVCYR